MLEKCKELGVEMVEGPHCYSFFEGNAVFAAKAETEFTAFYLTDFLVRQFDAFVWKPMGLDRHPELRDMYFGNYTKLVYQAQLDDPALDTKARDCAARLGLAYERRLTGYGDLATTLSAGGVAVVGQHEDAGWPRPALRRPLRASSISAASWFSVISRSTAMARKASQNAPSSDTLVRWPCRVSERLMGRAVMAKS